MSKHSKQWILQQIEDLLDEKENLEEHTLQLLYGEIPDWLPRSQLEQAKLIIGQLLNTGFTPEQITQFVLDETDGNLVVPGIVQDFSAFLHLVNQLGHIKYALSLPQSEGVERLAGALAVSGLKSAQGCKFRANYQSKLNFQDAAKPLFQANDYNIAKTIRQPELAEFARKNYGAHTLRNWLKEIRPAGAGPKGRPKNKR